MSRKTKIIISDTHIGAGGEPEGNLLEDFISDAEFVAWIHSLVEESDREGMEMDFIINGDWIEFLQVPAVDRFEPHRLYESDVYTGMSEDEALQRLEIVHEWHPSIFLGLSDFLNPGHPRRSLTILFGNHDPELVYPRLQARLRQMFNAEGDLADLVSVGGRIYQADGVYAEHGNAYAEGVNKFSDPDRPFDPRHPDRIERPSGSHVVTNFFNKLEWERPWVDGVHPLTSLIFYALAFEPVFALKVLKEFLKAAPHFLHNIMATPGPDQPPGPSQTLLDQLSDPDQEAELARRLTADPDFAADFAAQVQQVMIEAGAAPAPPEGIAAAPGDVPPELRARQIVEHYHNVLEEAANRIAEENGGVQVVLFGHIHERVERALPGGATYLNTGTWVWKGDFSDKPDEVWQDLLTHPEKYSGQRDLTYARVDIDESGVVIHAKLHRVGDEPTPPAPPPPPPPASFWARLLLTIRNFFKALFG